MAKLRDIWEMSPRGGLHRVGLRGVIPAPSLEGLGRICLEEPRRCPCLEKRGAGGDSVACLAPWDI